MEPPFFHVVPAASSARSTALTTAPLAFFTGGSIRSISAASSGEAGAVVGVSLDVVPPKKVVIERLAGAWRAAVFPGAPYTIACSWRKRASRRVRACLSVAGAVALCWAPAAARSGTEDDEGSELPRGAQHGAEDDEGSELPPLVGASLVGAGGAKATVLASPSHTLSFRKRPWVAVYCRSARSCATPHQRAGKVPLA